MLWSRFNVEAKPVWVYMIRFTVISGGTLSQCKYQRRAETLSEFETHCVFEFDTPVLNLKRVVALGEGEDNWQLPTMASYSSAAAADQSFPYQSQRLTCWRELTRVVNLKSHRPVRRWAAVAAAGADVGL